MSPDTSPPEPIGAQLGPAPDASNPPTCDFCGYNRTGLPAGRVCPECGYDPKIGPRQDEIERWYCSWRGALVVAPPFGALRLLKTPACRARALRRFFVWFVLPWVVCLLTFLLLSAIWVEVEEETWFESPDTPGIRHSLRRDGVAFRLDRYPGALIPEGGPPMGPPPTWRRTVFSRTVRFGMPDPMHPGVSLLLPVVICAVIGRVVAGFVLRSSLVFSETTAPRADLIWPALQWIGPPSAAMVALLVLDFAVLGARDTRLISLPTAFPAEALLLLPPAVFLLLGGRVIRLAAESVRPRGDRPRRRYPYLAGIAWMLATAMFITVPVICFGGAF